MTVEREPCGCRHNGGRYLELCPEHRAEYDAERKAHLTDTAARLTEDVALDRPTGA